MTATGVSGNQTVLRRVNKAMGNTMQITVPSAVGRLLIGKLGHVFAAELTAEGILFRYVGPQHSGPPPEAEWVSQ